jgi:alkylated DNA repair dioxygenase AlkB
MTLHTSFLTRRMCDETFLDRHVDTHSQFEGPIISVTLAAATVMELRPPNEPGDCEVPRESKFLHLTEGSLLVLDGSV